MHDLQPLNPLGGAGADHFQVAAVTLTENPNVALASVSARHGFSDACQAKLAEFLGAPVPMAGKARLGTSLDALWTGPDQWMVCAPFATHEDLATQLKSGFGDTASITEQTDAWACFDLQGVGIENVMERLCNLNLRAMAPADATRSTIDHMGCFVIRRLAQDSVRILGPRSSAGSLHHALVTAMRSAL
ncbi:MAG: sarcosine oxidase subunit gamma [Paracoccaceae bacterium]